jgi:hypothetical protein
MLYEQKWIRRRPKGTLTGQAIADEALDTMIPLIPAVMSRFRITEENVP